MTPRKLPFTLTLIAVSLSPSACVFDDDWTPPSDDNRTASFTFHTVDEIDVSDKANGDFDGFVFSAGASDLEAADFSNISFRSGTTQSSNRDLVGFMSERPSLGYGSSAREIADSIIVALDYNYYYDTNPIISAIDDISTISEQTYAGLAAITKAVSIVFDEIQSPTPTELTEALASYFGLNVLEGSLSNWPSPAGDEASSSNYTLYLTVVYESAEHIAVIASVTPADFADSYKHLLRSSTTPTNVTSNSVSLDNDTQTFTAVGGGGKADFLFVIDDSGSMSDDQQAVSEASEAFTTTMLSSGLDYEIGTITTGSDIEFRDTLGDGGFTNNLEEFKDDVTPGSSGSSTERGIYNAEQALLSLAYGDAEDGIVAQEGYPRQDANLSVVIIGDEPSQYPGTFDVYNNLFTERGYRVFTIIDTDLNDDSQYDDLANNSGGSIADIENLEAFPDIFVEIATLAGAASSLFKLDFTAVESTISVEINGKQVERGSENGWQYIVGSNSVIFLGDSVPQENDSVRIKYKHLPDTNNAMTPDASSIDARFPSTRKDG